MLGDSHSQVNSISQWTLSTDNKTAPWFGDEGVATGFREIKLHGVCGMQDAWQSAT